MADDDIDPVGGPKHIVEPEQRGQVEHFAALPGHAQGVAVQHNGRATAFAIQHFGKAKDRSKAVAAIGAGFGGHCRPIRVVQVGASHCPCKEVRIKRVFGLTPRRT